MKIDISLSGLTPEEARNVIAALVGDAQSVTHVDPPAVRPGPPVVEVAEETAEEIGAQLDAAVDAAEEADTGFDDGGRKETAQVAIGGGVAKAGDEVHAMARGEIGVVAATYRGFVAVEFEDGTKEMLAAGAVRIVPQSDATEEPAAPKKVEEKADVEDAEVVESTVTAAELRDIGRKLVEAKGPEAVFGVFAMFGANSVSTMPADKLGEAYAKIEELLDAA